MCFLEVLHKMEAYESKYIPKFNIDELLADGFISKPQNDLPRHEREFFYGENRKEYYKTFAHVQFSIVIIFRYNICDDLFREIVEFRDRDAWNEVELNINSHKQLKKFIKTFKLDL